MVPPAAAKKGFVFNAHAVVSSVRLWIWKRADVAPAKYTIDHEPWIGIVGHGFSRLVTRSGHCRRPIALGSGVGAESRRPLGIAVVGGLAFSQLITLYVTPVVYTYLDELPHRFARRRQRSSADPVPAYAASTQVEHRA